LNLKVAFISGDDIFGNFGELVRVGLQHLDGCDTEVKLAKETTAYLADPTQFDTVSAHAYLGARAIKRGLDLGCDIIICER
jgi:hypothetical protein